MITALRPGAPASLRPLRILSLSALALVLAILAACGSTVKPSIGPIEFTTASGANVSPIATVAVNGQVYMYATVTQDGQLLGVSWTVSCGSEPPPGSGTIDTSCGTLNPTQTVSGPIPTYPFTGILTTYTAPPAVPKGKSVTITAHVTSLPSINSSAVLTIETEQAGRGPATGQKTGVSPAMIANSAHARPATPGRGWPSSLIPQGL